MTTNRALPVRLSPRPVRALLESYGWIALWTLAVAAALGIALLTRGHVVTWGGLVDATPPAI